MLVKLFGSHARVSILKLFLLNPQEKYYVRQLARRLNLQVNSAKRELENLERFGLLTSRLEIVDLKEPEVPLEKADVEAGSGAKPENKNKGKALSKEGLTKENQARVSLHAAKQVRRYYKINPDFILLEEIKNLIIRSQMLYEKDFVEKVKKLGLIKLLVLTGVFAGNGNAPVDLMIVGKVNKGKFQALLKELEEELEKELNYTVMDYNEFKYRKDITDVFLYNILEGKKMVIIDEIGLI